MGSVWKRYFYQALDSKRVENQQIEVYEKGREICKMVIKRPLVNILLNRPTFGLYRLILNENDKEMTFFDDLCILRTSYQVCETEGPLFFN